MLLHQFLADSAAARPRAEALTCGGSRYDYATILDRVTRLAASLQRRGVARGDRVMVFGENRLETVLGCYAALTIGAVFVPVHPQTRREKLAYLLNDARPTCLITSAHLRGVASAALRGNASVLFCIVAGAAHAEAREGREFLPLEQALAEGDGPPHDPGTIDQDLASIIYTSGSTGEPKGVVLTHLNMVSAVTSIELYLDLRADDVILAVLPLAFGYGLYQVLLGFMVGARVVLERSFAFPVKTLLVMQEERVTVLPGVPTMFATLLGLDVLGRYDLRSLRLLTNAAAALPPRHIEELRRLLPRAVLYCMYGLTECQRVSYLPPTELDRRPTSVGRGMPNEEVYLVDEQGRRLPPGSTGELVVRGSHVMRGYWGKPRETAERLRPGPSPGELVLTTGDIFRMDEEGYLYFVARRDDIIKSQGMKVSPLEVESVLYGLPGVREAAVVGVPDERLGQTVKAFLVLKPGFHYTEREIVKHCLERLESFMAPKAVEFVEELPHTDSGKIRKRALTGAP